MAKNKQPYEFASYRRRHAKIMYVCEISIALTIAIVIAMIMLLRMMMTTVHDDDDQNQHRHQKPQATLLSSTRWPPQSLASTRWPQDVVRYECKSVQ